jgi:hypothetical protein
MRNSYSETVAYGKLLEYTASKYVSSYAKSENPSDTKCLKLCPRANLIQCKIQNKFKSLTARLICIFLRSEHQTISSLNYLNRF